MASLKAIRKRIKSVKNTAKITKAMKMVAAAKVKRAQNAIVALRPYANELEDLIIHRLYLRTADHELHPLLVERPVKKIELLVMTADRGLCGSFNSGIIKTAERFLRTQKGVYESISLSTVGTRGYDYFSRRGAKIRKSYNEVFEEFNFQAASTIGQELATHFQESDLDAVFLVYNEFRSIISQRPLMKQLLPLKELKLEQSADYTHGLIPPPNDTVDFLYEPSRGEILNDLLPRHLSVEIYRSMLESIVSEHGARMSAMDSATRNANKLISKLTLYYNRVRQAAITKELIEIVSGAEAI